MDPSGRDAVMPLPSAAARPVAGRVVLWSALAVFSQLAFVRLLTTMVGGTGYYANILLLVAMLACAAGFLATRLARFTLALPVLLLLAFYHARWLSQFNLIEQIPGEFFWSTVANVYPKPADFDMQLAVWLQCLSMIPVMLLIGAAQGEVFLAGRSGWAGYLQMGLGGLAGAVLFVIQNQLLSDPLTLCAIWSVGLGIGVVGTPRTRLAYLYAFAPLLVLLSAVAAYGAGHLWSPYQRITLVDRPTERHVLSNGFFITGVSKVRHDEIDPNLRTWYGVALAVARPEDRLLVLGSGCATSDVREAVHRNVRRIDAVEIEPTFIRLGRQVDPERTYDHASVVVHNTDARRFLGRTPDRFDLVYYSFLDSQTLASNQARFRLDSFLYTLDGLRLGWSRVAPGGALLVNFFCGTPWLQQRMLHLLRGATGADVQVIVSEDHPGGTLFIVSADRRAQLPAGGPFHDVSLGLPAAAPSDPVPSDDWPFFYSKRRRVPLEHLRLLLGVVFMLGFTMLLADRGGGASGLTQAPPGMLGYAAVSGAAFFFIELRTIAAATPVFGSTYLGQAMVIIGIIGMSLAGAAAAAGARPLPRASAWVALFLSLGLADGSVRWFHPYHGSLAPSALLFLAGLLAPAGVAGYLYLIYVRSLPTHDVLALQRFNLLGAAAGGLAECTTVVWGFRRSILVAAVLYALALACAEAWTSRRAAAPAPGPA